MSREHRVGGKHFVRDENSLNLSQNRRYGLHNSMRCVFNILAKNQIIVDLTYGSLCYATRTRTSKPCPIAHWLSQELN